MATGRIPRFFRADPDHEGMVKDQQVRRLVKLRKNEKTLTMAAARAGLSRKTARKYLKSGKLAEPVSAGAVLENSIGSVRVGMAGSGRDPEAIADGGGDSGVRLFVPSAGVLPRFIGVEPTFTLTKQFLHSRNLLPICYPIPTLGVLASEATCVVYPAVYPEAKRRLFLAA